MRSDVAYWHESEVERVQVGKYSFKKGNKNSKEMMFKQIEERKDNVFKKKNKYVVKYETWVTKRIWKAKVLKMNKKTRNK